MSSPLLLPVNPSEAVSVAELVFRLSGNEPFTPQLREKLRSNLATLGLEKLSVQAHTLAPDPVHAQTYYVVVATRDGQAWLLHMAPASSPESTLFAKPVLIARVRPAGEREIIINAIPVEGNLESIVTSLAPHLLARSSSLHHLWSIPIEADVAGFLRGFPRRPNLLPGLRAKQCSWEPYRHLLLSNWREGFVYILEDLRTVPSREEAKPFSRFQFQVESVADPRPLAEMIRELRGRTERSVDCELNFSPVAGVEAEAIRAFLDNLKLLGAVVQSVEAPPELALIAEGKPPSYGLTLPCQEAEQSSLPGRVHWKLNGF